MRRALPCMTVLSMLLSACAPMSRSPGAAATAPSRLDISLVNKLVWTNPVSGKPDGLRSAWPLAAMRGHTEDFPLAQIRQCAGQGANASANSGANAAPAPVPTSGAACNWGVLKASRTISAVNSGAGGVTLTLDLQLDIARSQQQAGPGSSAGMTIPSDVAALTAHRQVHLPLSLSFGQVWQLPLEAGVSYQLCVQRLDPARQPIDRCAIAFD